MDTENAWISFRQLSAGFGTMPTSGVESIPDQAGWALNARSLHSKAGAHFRRRLSQRPDKTKVFKPATFRGFRKGAESGRRWGVTSARPGPPFARRAAARRQPARGQTNRAAQAIRAHEKGGGSGHGSPSRVRLAKPPPERNPTMAVGDGPLLTEGTRWEQRVLRRLPVMEAWLCCTWTALTLPSWETRSRDTVSIHAPGREIWKDRKATLWMPPNRPPGKPFRASMNHA
jgi:hypothetical protein